MITASHCFGRVDDLATLKTHPLTHAYTSKNQSTPYISNTVDIYPYGDLAVVTFPVDTFKHHPQIPFGFAAPEQPQGIDFKVCGRNLSSVNAYHADTHHSMSCSSGPVKSFMCSTAQRRDWASSLPYNFAITENWGPAATFSQIHILSKSPTIPIHSTAKLNYKGELVPGDSGGGWFTNTEDGQERLIGVSTAVGVEGFDPVPEGKRPQWIAAGTCILIVLAPPSHGGGGSVAPAPAPLPAPAPAPLPAPVSQPTKTPEPPAQSPQPTPAPKPEEPEQGVVNKPLPLFPQLNQTNATKPYGEWFTKDVKPQTVERVAGASRIETATKLFDVAPNPSVAVLSTGRSYADGLTGGALAGALKTGLLLTNATGDSPLETDVISTLTTKGT